MIKNYKEIFGVDHFSDGAVNELQKFLQVFRIGKTLHDLQQGLAFYFSLLARRDIRHGANHTVGHAMLIAFDIASVDNISVRIVFEQEAVFLQPVRSISGYEGIQLRENSCTVIWMDMIVPPLFIGPNFLLWIPKDMLGVLTPKQLIGFGIPFPDHIVCGFGRQPILTFAAAQFFLHLLALGDIYGGKK